jgi:methylenetetrahydrofolate reductase (NADPH)
MFEMEQISRSGSSLALLDNYSLEMTAKDVASLELANALIPVGTSISVTFLPGELVDSRVAAAAAAQNAGFRPVPHISARRLGSEADLGDYLARLQAEAGVDSVFIVAGDPPQPMGPFEDTLSVIRTGLLARHGIKRVGVAGHPEGHPEIGEAQLWQAMKAKLALLADLGHEAEITTQFSFDADPVLAWLSRLRAEGITAPVKIGVAGPASVKTLLRFAARCGVGATGKVMAKYGISITKLLNTAGPDRLIQIFADRLDPDLHGQVVLHFYPFGGLHKTAEWVRDYRESR